MCRFFFFVVYVFAFLEGAKNVTRSILRRGKALVEAAFIAATNERNEYGRAFVPRGRPFTSSSSDVSQAALQCNVDVQFLDLAVPDIDGGARPDADETQHTRSGDVAYGKRMLTTLQATFVYALKVGMKAAFVCDF